MKAILFIASLLGLTLTWSGCALLPRKHPKDGSLISYFEAVEFMQAATEQKGARAYGRLTHIRNEEEYALLEGTVSPSAIKLTPLVVDRYRFKIQKSEIPDFTRLVRVHGEESTFIRDFWGPAWKKQREESGK